LFVFSSQALHQNGKAPHTHTASFVELARRLARHDKHASPWNDHGPCDDCIGCCAGQHPVLELRCEHWQRCVTCSARPVLDHSSACPCAAWCMNGVASYPRVLFVVRCKLPMACSSLTLHCCTRQGVAGGPLECATHMFRESCLMLIEHCPISPLKGTGRVTYEGSQGHDAVHGHMHMHQRPIHAVAPHCCCAAAVSLTHQR
jgi:hypothetical protein